MARINLDIQCIILKKRLTKCIPTDMMSTYAAQQKLLNLKWRNLLPVYLGRLPNAFV